MANATRTSYRTMAAALALKVVQRWGDTVTYTAAGSEGVSIYAFSPSITRQTNGPDEETVTWIIPYQTNFTASPSSGDTITYGGVKWIIDTVRPDDGQWPASWELDCQRWLHSSPEVQ